jgi:hypothetical protein
MELYVYEDVPPGSGQLPVGLYGATPACELCELPLFTLEAKGLRPSTPVTPAYSLDE